MAIQLNRVTGLTYTATYQLTGGETATVTQAQKPTRTAYVYPSGRLIQTLTGTVRCTGDKTGIASAASTAGTASTGTASAGTAGAAGSASGTGTTGTTGTTGPTGTIGTAGTAGTA